MARRRRRRRQRPPEPELPSLSLDEIASRIETVLEASPADETEIAWLESSRQVASTQRASVPEVPGHERTILIRVIERGRLGSFRTGSPEFSDLEIGVRHAIAQSRTREALPGLPHLPNDSTETPEIENLFDAEVAGLGRGRAVSLLRETTNTRKDCRASLEWASIHLAVCNSRGLRRRTSVTGVAATVREGNGPGSGRATTASRSLARLGLERLVDRAARRRAGGEPAEPPEGPVPVVLSPEAVIQLLSLLNRVAFSASAYHDGTSFLREHLGVQVFDRKLTVLDDATDASGLPIPFDLEGTAKRRVDLIAEGTPKTPALDQRQAALLGLPPTGHAIAANDARAENLFVDAGELSDEEVLASAEGGLWISWLDPIECFDPSRVQMRSVARGVRRVENGELGRAIPDLRWNDSILRVFSSLQGVGRDRQTAAVDGFLGGITAPPLVLPEVSALTPLG